MTSGFKTLKRGPVAGNVTYGWLIFTTSAGLMNGGSFLLPYGGCYTAAGAPGFARGSASAVLARGYMPRASGEPKARPLTLDGQDIETSGGIKPDILVISDLSHGLSGQDPQLEKAVEKALELIGRKK